MKLDLRTLEGFRKSALLQVFALKGQRLSHAGNTQRRNAGTSDRRVCVGVSYCTSICYENAKCPTPVSVIWDSVAGGGGWGLILRTIVCL